MLTILIGRAKTGKSDTMLRRMAELGESSQQILLVPEHASHQAEVDVSAILTGRGVGLACPETKQLCCYAGDTRQVQSAMEELAIRAEKEKCEEKEAFTDNVIMYEVLSELKDIAARGGIRCTCGSAEYGIQVHRDAVDLICRRCGGKLRLPAGTDEDLDRLCCQMKLTIRGAE